MKSLRWTKPSRHKDLLHRLGAIPHECGLQPIFASVRLADYKIASHVPRTFQNGYFVALAGVTMSILEAVPKSERVELIFEEQRVHAVARETALGWIAKTPKYKRRGRPRLAKWSSTSKSILLEPADYLAYAILQTLIDPDSTRAFYCRPILTQGLKRIGGKLGKESVAKIIPILPQEGKP